MSGANGDEHFESEGLNGSLETDVVFNSEGASCHFGSNIADFSTAALIEELESRATHACQVERSSKIKQGFSEFDKLWKERKLKKERERFEKQFEKQNDIIDEIKECVSNIKSIQKEVVDYKPVFINEIKKCNDEFLDRYESITRLNHDLFARSACNYVTERSPYPKAQKSNQTTEENSIKPVDLNKCLIASGLIFISILVFFFTLKGIFKPDVKQGEVGLVLPDAHIVQPSQIKPPLIVTGPELHSEAGQ